MNKMTNRKKHIRILLIVLFSFVVIAASFFTIDYLRIKRYKTPPFFCIPVYEYENGSTDYYGIGYKIWKDYDSFDNETEYYITFWILPKFWHI